MQYKTKTTFTLYSFALVICLLFTICLSNCKKIDNDTQPPKIIMYQPSDSAKYSLGNDFLVVTTMQDFVSLASYRYRVFWKDDSTNVSPNPSDTPLNIDKSEKIQDVNYHIANISFRITIPINARKGFYNLDVYCYDKAGNEGKNHVLIEFKD